MEGVSQTNSSTRTGQAPAGRSDTEGGLGANGEERAKYKTKEMGSRI